MAKPNAQVQLIHALRRIRELEYELENARLAATLFCDDAAVIAAHNVFHRTGAIIAEFSNEYQRISQEIAKLAVDDSKTELREGRYLEYAKETIDRAVLEAVTEEYFSPFDIRHRLGGDAI